MKYLICLSPVKPDDLIMRGVSGEEYPIGRAIFDQTYTFDIAAQLAPVQEPVAWASQTALDIAAEGGEGIIVGAEADCLIPLYTVPQPVPVQEPVYAFRRKGMDDFCTCNKARFDELASKPHLFETAIFYTSQPRKAVKLSDSEIASDASRHWSEDGVDPIAFAHAIESAVWAKNGWAE